MVDLQKKMLAIQEEFVKSDNATQTVSTQVEEPKPVAVPSISNTDFPVQKMEKSIIPNSNNQLKRKVVANRKIVNDFSNFIFLYHFRFFDFSNFNYLAQKKEKIFLSKYISIEEPEISIRGFSRCRFRTHGGSKVRYTLRKKQTTVFHARQLQNSLLHS